MAAVPGHVVHPLDAEDRAATRRARGQGWLFAESDVAQALKASPMHPACANTRLASLNRVPPRSIRGTQAAHKLGLHKAIVSRAFLRTLSRQGVGTAIEMLPVGLRGLGTLSTCAQ